MLGILPRYREVDLPVFTSETVGSLHRGPIDYNNTSRLTDNKTFVREVDLIPYFIMFGSLKRVLKHTDKQLDRAAEYCDASVIGHTWGLYRSLPHRTMYNGPSFNFRRFIPYGYTLAAEVDCLEDISHFGEWDDETHRTVINGVCKYNRWPMKRLRGGLGDIECQQFSIATNRNKQTVCSEPELTLHDIEPVFRGRGALII